MINKLVANIKKQEHLSLSDWIRCFPMYQSRYRKRHLQSMARLWKEQREAIWQFNKEIVDKTYDLIPAVKPQIAMYEQFGIPGLQAFKKTVDYCKEKRTCCHRRYQER